MAVQVGPQSNYKGQSELWSPRWYPLMEHPAHTKLWQSMARFVLVPAGRRSGKTELAKRKGVLLAVEAPAGSLLGFCAPTYAQAKSIYWEDLKKLVPRLLVKKISESDLTIRLVTRTEIRVIGMDKPSRVEGTPWYWLCLDEFANMKPSAWTENVYPALSTRGAVGSAWLIGVPEGRNHYYDLVRKAKERMRDAAMTGTRSEWEVHTWHSADILPASVVEQARADLDPLTFAQEYEADFVNFAGRAYYAFDVDRHVVPVRQKYNPKGTLYFCFDFNVEPGTATICQYVDVTLPVVYEAVKLDGRTVFGAKAETRTVEALAVIDEVWIPRNSTTPAVCDRIISQWGNHEGRIELAGDATGGARGTAKLDGSDWDIILSAMYRHFGASRVKRVGRRNMESGAWYNPSERARVNAVNSRLLSGDGVIRLVVDPSCVHTRDDLDGVRLLEGGSGEIDKKHDPKLTHLSDGLGYLVEFKHPTRVGGQVRVTEGLP